MYPQERFACYKRPFWHVLCLKCIGLPCCILIVTIVTCSLQIILLSNWSLLTVLALADITLLKTTCHFLLLLVGFDTLTYRKELQLIPCTCGSSVTSMNPEAPDNLTEALHHDSVVKEHQTLMAMVAEKIQSARSGLNKAFTSLLTGFEVCDVIF